MKKILIICLFLAQVTFSAEFAEISHEVKAHAEVNYDKMLLEAARDNDIEKLKIALDHLPDLEHWDWSKFETLPIQWAAFHGNFEAIDLLLKSGLNLNFTDQRNDNAINWAVFGNKLGVLERYWDLIDDIVRVAGFRTGVGMGKLEFVKFFLSKGVQVSFQIIYALCVSQPNNKELRDLLFEIASKNGDVYPNHFHECALFGHSEIIKAFIKSGVDINAKTNDNFTCLHLVAKNLHDNRGLLKDLENTYMQLKDHPLFETHIKEFMPKIGDYSQALKVLLEHGAQILTPKKPILNAIDKAWGENISSLLQNILVADEFALDDIVDACNKKEITQAQLNKQDKWGLTPIGWAALRNNEEIIETLHKYAQDQNIEIFQNVSRRLELPKKIDPKNLLRKYDRMLLRATKSGDIESMRLAIINGANVNTQDDEGATPMHLACYSGNCQALDLLFEKNGSLETTDADGFVPFHYAIANNQFAVIERYIKYVIEVDNKQHRVSFLSQSIINDNKDLVKLLLSYKARFADPTTAVTPLCVAAKCGNGRPEILKMLLEHISYDPKIIDAVTVNEATPLRFAANFGHYEIVKILLAAQANINGVENTFSPIHTLLVSELNREQDEKDCSESYSRFEENGLSFVPQAMRAFQLKEKPVYDDFKRTLFLLLRKGTLLPRAVPELMYSLGGKFHFWNSMAFDMAPGTIFSADHLNKLLSNNSKIESWGMQSINFGDRFCMNPLMWGIVRKDMELFNKLTSQMLKKNIEIDLSYVNIEGETVLTLARRAKNKEILRQVLILLRENVSIIRHGLKENLSRPITFIILQYLYDIKRKMN